MFGTLANNTISVTWIEQTYENKIKYNPWQYFRCFVSGWGHQTSGSKKGTTKLMETDVIVANDEVRNDCRWRLDSWARMTRESDRHDPSHVPILLEHLRYMTQSFVLELWKNAVIPAVGRLHNDLRRRQWQGCLPGNHFEHELITFRDTVQAPSLFDCNWNMPQKSN